MLIGITGSIACGKSTIINYLKEFDYNVVDCDELTRDCMKKGRAAYYEIIHHFSKDILNKKKEICRHTLGHIVFNDKEKKALLESIIHPRIIRDLQHKDKYKVWFVEVPLLYEANMEDLFYKVIVVRTIKQVERLCKRNNIDINEANNLINNQMSQEEKAKRADYVIDNDGPLTETFARLNEIVTEIMKDKPKARRPRYEI